MKIIPDAKLVDIKVVELPNTWANVASEKISSNENNQIKLIHEPSNTCFSVQIVEVPGTKQDAAVIQGKAKIKFIHELHGEAWLNDD